MFTRRVIAYDIEILHTTSACLMQHPILRQPPRHIELEMSGLDIKRYA